VKPKIPPKKKTSKKAAEWESNFHFVRGASNPHFVLLAESFDSPPLLGYLVQADALNPFQRSLQIEKTSDRRLFCSAPAIRIKINGERGSARRPVNERLTMRAPMAFPSSDPRDPLHGVMLETIVTRLVERHGWAR
jgi:hypothetical protein